MMGVGRLMGWLHLHASVCYAGFVRMPADDFEIVGAMNVVQCARDLGANAVRLEGEPRLFLLCTAHLERILARLMSLSVPVILSPPISDTVAPWSHPSLPAKRPRHKPHHAVQEAMIL
jgi:hypothetical protein